MAVVEQVLTLQQALAPHVESARARRRAAEEALESRLADLITADDPSEGVAVWGRRLVGCWVADVESEPVPSTVAALGDGPLRGGSS